MLRLRVPAGGVVSARGMGCRCRRAAARPPRGTARVFLREVLAGHAAQAYEPLARHNRTSHEANTGEYSAIWVPELGCPASPSVIGPEMGWARVPAVMYVYGCSVRTERCRADLGIM